MKAVLKSAKGQSWLLLLLVRLVAATWMLETKASLFELSEVFQFD